MEIDMTKINCLNPIAKVGLDLFTDNYNTVDNFEEADAVLVRSAAMHDIEMPDSLKQSQEQEQVLIIFLLKNVQKKVL